MNARVKLLFPVVICVSLFGAGAMAAAPRAYISRCCDSGSSLVYLDVKNETQLARVPFGHEAGNVTMSADGNTAYFLDASTVSLLVLDISTRHLAANISLGVLPGDFFGFLSNQMIAVTPDGSRAYVALNVLIGANVAVVDLVNQKLITKVATGIFSPSAAVLSKDGKYVYFPGQDFCLDECEPGTVSVLDTATNQIVTTMFTEFGSSSAVLSPDGSRLYVANVASVTYYDTATNTYLGSIPVPSASGLAIKKDGTQLYVAEAGSPAVGVIDTASETLVSTVSLTKGAANITLNPNGSEAYILDGAGGVSVLKTVNNTLVAVFSLTVSAGSIGFTHGGSQALLTDSVSSTIALASPITNKVSGLIFGPPTPGLIAVSPDRGRLYVTGNGGLAIFDPSTEKQIGFIRVPYGIQAISISGDGSKALLAVFDPVPVKPISAAVVDLTSGAIVATIANQGFGYSAALSADGLTGYIGDFNTLIVIDMTTFQITQTVQFGGNRAVAGLLLSRDGSHLYASVASLGILAIYATDSFHAVAQVNTGVLTATNIRMAQTEDGAQLLIPDHAHTQLVFVDLSTRTVVGTTLLPGTPVAVAITPDGKAAWTALEYTALSKTMPVVDIATKTVTALVDVSGTAADIAFLP